MSIESREFTFNVSSPAQLKLNNISGSVVIEPGEDGNIHVLAIKQPGRGDTDSTKIECVQAEDGSVSISTKFSDPGWTWLFGTQVCDVDYVVRAPRKCSLVINGVSNSLKVSGFEGNFVFKTVSGDISGESLTGSCQLNSVSGDINLKDSSIIQANVKTVSGDITLQTGFSDEGPYQFHTVSGDIRLVVPSTSNCNVEMHSVSGDFSTNLPVNQLSHNHGNHTSRVGMGGVQVSLNSVSGDLILECDGEFIKPAVKNSIDILSKVETGELSVEEALAQLNG